MLTIPKLIFTADVDTLASLYKGKGLRKGGYSYAEYEQGFERMLLLSREFGFKWTLFTVGNDLRIDQNAAILKQMLRDGHEIACHSMTHPQGFRLLSPEAQKKEIEEFDKIVAEKLNTKAVGFRAPGWNASAGLAEVLLRQGYQYDSSVFPTYLAPVLKGLHWWTMKTESAANRTALGPWSFMFAPAGPYRSERKNLGRPGTDGILEYPVPVTPGMRVPFYATYHLARGYRSFENGLAAILRAGASVLHYQFHLSDFVDYSQPVFETELPSARDGRYLPQAFQTPLEKKTELWRRIIDQLTGLSRSLTTLARAGDP